MNTYGNHFVDGCAESTPWDIILDDDDEYYDEVYADDLRHGVYEEDC